MSLPSAPLLKRLSRGSGSTSSSPTPRTLTALPPSPLPPKETSRILKWQRMLQPETRDQGGNVQTWKIKTSKASKLRSRTYKGIPDCWRGAAWDLLMLRYSALSHKDMVALGAEYRDGMEKPSSYDIQIDLDVPRTISGHLMFRTRYGAGYVSWDCSLSCCSR